MDRGVEAWLLSEVLFLPGGRLVRLRLLRRVVERCLVLSNRLVSMFWTYFLDCCVVTILFVGDSNLETLQLGMTRLKVPKRRLFPKGMTDLRALSRIMRM